MCGAPVARQTAPAQDQQDSNAHTPCTSSNKKMRKPLAHANDGPCFAAAPVKANLSLPQPVSGKGVYVHPRLTPGVVVARVDTDGVPVALQPLVEVLVGKVLVPAQRVRVRQGGVQLQRAQEEAQRRLMLLAKCKASWAWLKGLRPQSCVLHAWGPPAARAGRSAAPPHAPGRMQSILDLFKVD